MTERELREAFQELTSEIRPAPHGYTRLMERNRRGNRMRVVGWSTALAAVLSAAIFGTVGLQGLAGPNPTDGSSSPPGFENGAVITAWTRQLIDAPIRGGLGSDASLVQELTARLHTRFPGGDMKILFLDDVNDQRVTVAVQHTATQQVGITIVSRGGAGAQEIAKAATESFQDGSMVMVAALRPFSTFGMIRPIGSPRGSVTVGLAPPGCTIATATAPQPGTPPQWQGAGADLITIGAVNEELLAQVTCAGTVRFQGVLTGLVTRKAETVTDEQYHAAGAERARGSFPEDIARRMLGDPMCAEIGELIFGGTVPGQSGPEIYVSQCRRQAGDWSVLMLRGDGSGSGLLTTADLGPLTSIIVLPTEAPDVYLVLAPRAATRLETDGVSSELGAGVATITIPAGQTRALRAFDVGGNEVGAGPAPLPQPQVTSVEHIENW